MLASVKNRRAPQNHLLRSARLPNLRMKSSHDQMMIVWPLNLVREKVAFGSGVGCLCLCQ